MLKIQGKIGTVNFWIIFLIERKSSYFIEYFFKISCPANLFPLEVVQLDIRDKKAAIS